MPTHPSVKDNRATAKTHCGNKMARKRVRFSLEDEVVYPERHRLRIHSPLPGGRRRIQTIKVIVWLVGLLAGWLAGWMDGWMICNKTQLMPTEPSFNNNSSTIQLGFVDTELALASIQLVICQYSATSCQHSASILPVPRKCLLSVIRKKRWYQAALWELDLHSIILLVLLLCPKLPSGHVQHYPPFTKTGA